LLGAPDLLPVDSDIATSVVFKVMYGHERKFKIFFQPDVDTGKRKEPIEVPQNQLKNYGTENGNPRNEKRVDFIGVEEPNPMLSEGIVIVDTPGVGGLFKAHRDVSWRYAPNADAIFFVLDSVESLMSSDEVNFLKELRERLKKQVFFVQTKIDAVDEKQVTTWQSRNRDILQKNVGIPENNIKYFPISSKLKNNADELQNKDIFRDSGFLTLLDFIHRGLKAKKDEMLARQFASSIAIFANEIYADLKSKQTLLTTQSKTEIAKTKEELDKARTNLNQWERESFQQEMNRFRNEFEDIKRKYRRIVQDEFDPNGEFVKELIRTLRSIENLEPQVMVERSKEFQDIWLSDVGNYAQKIHTEYNREVTELVKSISSKLDETKTSFSTEIVPFDNQNQMNNPTISAEMIYANFSTFENLRTNMYGGVAGGSMATIAVMFASTVFPPAAALIAIAPFIGGFLGGYFANEDLQKKRREEVISKLKQNIQSLAAQILRTTLNNLDDMNVNYERKINELFKRIVDDARKRLESQSEQVRLVIAQTKEQNENNLKEINERIKKVETLLQIIKTFLTDNKSNDKIS
jgi:hypothetical protein